MYLNARFFALFAFSSDGIFNPPTIPARLASSFRSAAGPLFFSSAASSTISARSLSAFFMSFEYPDPALIPKRAILSISSSALLATFLHSSLANPFRNAIEMPRVSTPAALSISIVVSVLVLGIFFLLFDSISIRMTFTVIFPFSR